MPSASFFRRIHRARTGQFLAVQRRGNKIVTGADVYLQRLGAPFPVLGIHEIDELEQLVDVHIGVENLVSVFHETVLQQ